MTREAHAYRVLDAIDQAIRVSHTNPLLFARAAQRGWDCMDLLVADLDWRLGGSLPASLMAVTDAPATRRRVSRSRAANRRARAARRRNRSKS